MHRLGWKQPDYEFRIRKSKILCGVYDEMVDINDLVHFNALNILQEAEILANNPPRRLNQFLDPFEYYNDCKVISAFKAHSFRFDRYFKTSSSCPKRSISPQYTAKNM